MKKKNTKYYLIGIIILAVAIIGLFMYMPISKKRHAAEELKQKYHEEFKIISYSGIKLSQDYYTVEAYSVEYPNLIFRASIDNKSGDIMDSYVTKRLCSRISDKISQNLKTLKDDYYVFTEAMLEDTLLTDPTISIEEYLKEETSNIFTIYLCIDQNGSSAQNIVTSVNNMLNGLPEFSGSVEIFLTDTNLLARIKEYVESNSDTYFEFDEMTEDTYIGTISFENGHVALTEYTLNKMITEEK